MEPFRRGTRRALPAEGAGRGSRAASLTRSSTRSSRGCRRTGTGRWWRSTSPPERERRSCCRSEPGRCRPGPAADHRRPQGQPCACRSCRRRPTRSCGCGSTRREMGDLIPPGRRQPLWWTLRRPLRPLTYHAAHRMFERPARRWARTGRCTRCVTPRLPDGRGPGAAADRCAVRARPRPADNDADLPDAPQGGCDPPGAGPPRRADRTRRGRAASARQRPATGPRRLEVLFGADPRDRSRRTARPPVAAAAVLDAAAADGAAAAGHVQALRDRFPPRPSPKRLAGHAAAARGVLAGSVPAVQPGRPGARTGQLHGPRAGAAARLARRPARRDLAGAVAGQRRRRRRGTAGRALPTGGSQRPGTAPATGTMLLARRWRCR